MLLLIVAVLALVSSAGICFFSNCFESLCWLWVLPVSFLGSFLALGLLYFLFVWVACALVDMKKPQEKDSAFYRWITVTTASAIMPILRMRMEVKGLENVPKEGRFLLVCNHLSDLDPVVLIYYFRKYKISFISKWENSSMFLVGKVMHKMRCQLINRENDREALKTILSCIRLLKEDECSIGVFPEGYTSTDGLLHEFRGGVFKIAQKANVPIVVCTLKNTQHVFRNIKRLKATQVTLNLVGVIPGSEIKGVTAIDVSNRAYRMMAEDLGPALVKQNSENT